MSWDDLNSAHYDWPSVDDVRCYREKVAIMIEQLIDNMELTLPITQDSLAWIILMGCEHENIHIETSSVIMRMLPLADITASILWATCQQTDNAPSNELVSVKGKVVNLGKLATDDTFGWDNEYGQASIELEDFHAAKYLVSNQEYMAFVDAGGYHCKAFWTDEGQQWLAFSQACMPRFWLEKAGQYWQRNLLNEIPLPLDWPAEVNYLEAKAFCNWKNSVAKAQAISAYESESKVEAKAEPNVIYRLPTEAEWLCLRDKVTGDLPSWDIAPGNLNHEHYASSCPVNMFAQGDFFDIVGNVWQWTESAIDGFEGFSVHPLYDDFSTPTFDGQHNLIKGGSWVSCGNEAMKSSRYAFRRHFFQHAGFRYVASAHDYIPNLADNHYETDSDVCIQLHHHTAQLNYLTESNKKKDNAALLDPNYFQVLQDILLTTFNAHSTVHQPKLLELGCSVGGLSFILAKYFQHIDAIDMSARYIQHGVKLQLGQSLRYVMPREGELSDFHEIVLNEQLLSTAKNINFSQGDIANLKTLFTGYDMVLAHNVLEKSYDPELFLSHVHSRLNTGGLLAVVSDYAFDEQMTNKNKWLGGQKINGENVTGFETLSLLLSQQFTLVEEQTLIRTLMKNNRHFSLTKPHLSIWKIKDIN
jgi:5-histidylcysteine sulfoxide synthase/putative 4-mercaptohistidine N1-methyltranferase